MTTLPAQALLLHSDSNVGTVVRVEISESVGVGVGVGIGVGVDVGVP